VKRAIQTVQSNPLFHKVFPLFVCHSFHILLKFINLTTGFEQNMWISSLEYLADSSASYLYILKYLNSKSADEPRGDMAVIFSE
jgi:hypothetical protein